VAVVVGVLLLRAASALAQGDSALRAWEPAVTTNIDRPRQGDGRLTPDALQGPPTPVTLYAIAALDRDQLSRYTAAYRAHMSATWDARYGVASAVKLLDQAVTQRDEDAARYYSAVADRLWSRVVEEDRGFDDVVAALLRKDQQKRYREWKRKLAEGEAEQGRLTGAPSPG
jgi:hypothetical protein